MTETTIVLLTIIILLVIMSAYERQRASKREDALLNRIMAKHFRDYTAGVKELEEPAGEVPTVEDVKRAMLEDNEGYALNGVSVV